ncbi:ATP-dependent helicase HrpB [Schaalia vaccimaxillae]|uniref:ATP-dependent helicase HrpB n=1 Tax=Schaalia vaccimaxillae TaxID=183916 RepID=UPI0003B5D6B7|nr:ATP-dependent helicase HrpB [Schaalia vaccimaxillae]
MDTGWVRSLEDLIASPPDLPVVSALPAIIDAGVPGLASVVTAPPGTGKTTLLPPALTVGLAEAGAAGKVLVTQPRRVAVRAAARRIASLLGEKVGGQVGYTVRGDSQTSRATRVEMVTPGILLRRLQSDPELPGVCGVVLDEFHERDLDTDLALAFLLDVRSTVREDLTLSLTSATLEADRTSALLAQAIGEKPATINIPGVAHPLDIRWAPPARGMEALGPVGPDRIGVRREFLGHIARTIMDALDSTDGDILVFLPGVGEIESVRALLGSPDGADVRVLHGALPARDQDEVLSPGSRRRIVLSTSIAESSLTVPGVRVVIDSGLAREPRLDAGRAVTRLATVPASRARLEQRAGRAARLGAGVAIRLMDEVEWARRPSQSAPGIAVEDLTDARLQAAVWGNADMASLALLDAPPVGSLEAAGGRLRSLGAIDEVGAPTAMGRELARFPLDPPLGRALVDSAPQIGRERAARYVALLSEDPRVPAADLAAFERRLSSSSDHGLKTRVRDQSARLLSLVSDTIAATQVGDSSLSHEDALALVVALARPEWIARKRPDSPAYLLANGLGAQLPANSPLEGEEWLAVAGIDRSGTSRQARILSAVPISPDDALRAAAPLRSCHVTISLQGDKIRAFESENLGAIELSTRPTDSIDEAQAFDIVTQGLSKQGLASLGWNDAATNLRARMSALHQAIGAPWPDVSDEALIKRADEWLAPHTLKLAQGTPLSQISMLDALRALLPWPDAARLDELAPESLEIPAGGLKKIDWSTGTPILTLRVQQAFGWVDTPVLADGRLPLLLHLTDPAGRPAAVTSDLRSFWSGPYQDVRSQLRGRYPKHPWPEDPVTAQPTSRAKPRVR